MLSLHRSAAFTGFLREASTSPISKARLRRYATGYYKSSFSAGILGGDKFLKAKTACQPVPDRVHLISVAHLSHQHRSFHIDQTNWRSSGGAHLPPTRETFLISADEYEHIAEETLESLTSYFDEIIEESPVPDADVAYSSGVLTVKLGRFGTYVLNKQTPNRQIWLSSPSSGPKRYDFIDGTWIYKHDGVPLYRLLNNEIPKILNSENIDFERRCFNVQK